MVIRTFNEERYLPAVLDAIARQSYRDLEIVVVDSGSIDRTRDIARERADKFLTIESHDFTFGYSLNVGIRAAAGRYVAILSAHAIPVDEGWLEALIEPLRSERTALTYGRQSGAPGSNVGETLDLRREFGPEPRVLRPPRFFAHNANSAIRHDLWLQTPFDEALPGLEDIAWAKHWMLAGFEVVYVPTARVYHMHHETPRQVQRRYHREAVAARALGLKGRRDAVRPPLGEIARAVSDIPALVLGGQAREIPALLTFRLNKAMGTVQGLMDDAALLRRDARESLFFDRISRSVVIRGPGHATLEEREIPPLKPGDALVRVAYVGVCATDLEILDGSLGYYSTGVASYPIVPGHEMSGVVAAVGPRVVGVREGDRVVVEPIQGCGQCAQCERSNAIGCASRAELGVIGRDGAYSEYVVVAGRFLHRIPEGLDLRAAAVCEPLAVVLKGLRRLAHTWPETPSRKRCVVVGAGPIGHLAAKILAARGHAVTVLDRDEARLRLLADHGIDTRSDFQLAEFDVLVEATGDADALYATLARIAPGTTVLLLGLPYAHKPFSFEQVVAYEHTIVGSVGSSSEDFDEALAILPTLDVAPFLREVVRLERFAEAWETVRARRALKVLLEIA